MARSYSRSVVPAEGSHVPIRSVAADVVGVERGSGSANGLFARSVQDVHGNAFFQGSLGGAEGDLGALLLEGIQLDLGGVEVAAEATAFAPNSAVNEAVAGEAVSRSARPGASPDLSPRLEGVGRGGGAPLPAGVAKQV